MASYKELREYFREEIELGNVYCILSGLPIEKKEFLTLEHFVPLHRVSHTISAQPRNIFPAYRIINHIKSSMLPCEFFECRDKLLRKTYNKHTLDRQNQQILRDAIDNIPYYNIDPCTLCVMSNLCYQRT